MTNLNRDRLEKKLKRLNSNIDYANKNIEKWSIQQAEAYLAKEKIEKKLKNFKENPPNLTVTDHAFIRYLERFCEFDIEKLKGQLISTELKKMVGDKLDGRFSIDGITYVIKDRQIVTVLS